LALTAILLNLESSYRALNTCPSSDSQLEGDEKVKPIEPLVESEPLGLIWSVNEIEDFRDHINDLKDIYNKNLV